MTGSGTGQTVWDDELKRARGQKVASVTPNRDRLPPHVRFTICVTDAFSRLWLRWNPTTWPLT